MKPENVFIVMAIITACALFLMWLHHKAAQDDSAELKRSYDAGFAYAKYEYEAEPTVQTIQMLEDRAVGFDGDSPSFRAFDRGIAAYLRGLHAMEIPG